MKDKEETNAYTDFAQVYDALMDNVPYDQWADGYHRILLEHGIEDGLICDLACGSGNMTERLAALGYDMIGVDDAEAMLNIARSKRHADQILYLLQDMCEFELYGTVRACTLVCDSLNYLLEEQELLALFSHVNNYLDPGGIFLFDFNTREKYEHVIGNTAITENREDISFIWDNYYDTVDGINECELTVFVREAGSSLFRRFSETHLQRGYEPEQIRTLLTEAGMEVLACMTMEEAGLPADAGRYLVVAREKGKQNG